MAPEADGNSNDEEYKEAFPWLSMVVSAGVRGDLWGGVALNKKFEVWNTVVIRMGASEENEWPQKPTGIRTMKNIKKLSHGCRWW